MRRRVARNGRPPASSLPAEEQDRENNMTNSYWRQG